MNRGTSNKIINCPKKNCMGKLQELPPFNKNKPLYDCNKCGSEFKLGLRLPNDANDYRRCELVEEKTRNSYPVECPDEEI